MIMWNEQKAQTQVSQMTTLTTRRLVNMPQIAAFTPLSAILDRNWIHIFSYLTVTLYQHTRSVKSTRLALAA